MAETGSPEVVAVIDCGASAVRAYIGEVAGNGTTRVLENLTWAIDMIPSLASGRMDRAAMDDIVDGLAHMEASCRAYGVSRLRCVGTAVLREVANRDVLIERVAQAFGFELEVIDAAEEARLYSEALRVLVRAERLPLKGKSLLVDIGAGSTNLSVIQGDKLIYSIDDHYGTVRCAETFADLQDSPRFAPTVDRFSAGAARMTLRRLPLSGARRLLVTGTELRHFAQAHLPDEHAPMVPVEAAAIEAWCSENRQLTRSGAMAERLTDQVDPMRMIAAMHLLKHLCRELDREEVWIPRLNLRDGLLADLRPGAQGPQNLTRGNLLAEAKSLCSRFKLDRQYAANTAALAVQIFDQSHELHHLGQRERCLLEFAAWVHDIGAFINVRNRHKHTMYLIMSSDIAGLTQREKAMVANIARYHRKAAPLSSHREFMALTRHDRVVVSLLAAILRLAYGLDVDREQRIRRVRCQVHEGRFLVHVDRRQIELERWSLREKSNLFREVIGLPVEVIGRKED